MAAAQAVDGENAKPVVAAGKRSMLRMIIMALLALTVLGGGAGAYVMLFSPKKTEKADAAPKPPTFFDLPDVVVNLSTPAGERPQYLKAKIVLELADAGLVARVQAVLPRVMDAFQVFLRELRASDLEGSVGVYRMKEELTRRVNAAIAPSRISAVLFKEMLVQ